MLTRHRQDFTSYRVLREVESPANTDHRIVIAKYKIQFTPVRRKNIRKHRINVEKVANDKSLQDEYSLRIQNRFDAMVDLSNDAEQTWTFFRTS